MNDNQSTQSRYDKENAMYCVSIYFHNALRDFGTGQPLMMRRKGKLVPRDYMKYYLKYTDDNKYPDDPKAVSNYELHAFIRTVKKGIANNSVKRVQLYYNANKGQTIEGENPEVVRLEFRNNQITEVFISKDLSPEWQAYISNVINHLKSEIQ
jgi:hypothetical protein